MKKLLLFFILFISSLQVYAQRTITYEEMKTITKGAFETIQCDVYLAKDGYSYKVGDTLKIGRPSTNKTFAFITSGSTLAALNGQMPQPITVNSSGTNTIIKKINVGGNKRMGFKIGITSSGVCGMCPNNFIDFEQALATGEIESKGYTKESALAKLKQAKDMLDLGLIKQEEFDKLKETLKSFIMQ